VKKIRFNYILEINLDKHCHTTNNLIIFIQKIEILDYKEKELQIEL